MAPEMYSGLPGEAMGVRAEAVIRASTATGPTDSTELEPNSAYPINGSSPA